MLIVVPKEFVIVVQPVIIKTLKINVYAKIINSSIKGFVLIVVQIKLMALMMIKFVSLATIHAKTVPDQDQITAYLVKMEPLKKDLPVNPHAQKANIIMFNPHNAKTATQSVKSAPIK